MFSGLRDMALEGLSSGLGVGGGVDGAADDKVVGAGSQRILRRRDAGLIASRAAGQANAGRYD